jgi:multidrug efflux system membrane fusion protein
MEPENSSGADSRPYPVPPAEGTRRTLPRILRWVIVGGIAALVVAVIVHQIVTFASQPQQTRRGRFLDGGNQPVGVARIRRGDIRLTLRALGAVTPLTTVTVNAQISGLLMSVGYKEGQLVRKGQFLAQIDPRPYEVALEQDVAQLARDDATLKQAQMDMARYKTLADQQSIARQTYEDQVWIVKQDQGAVDMDKAQIKAQQLNLDYCHIIAPSDGRVGLRLVDPGNYVQVGSSTGLVVLTRLKPTTVEYAVPEDALPQITARVHSGAKLPVTAFDRANVTQLATGEFASIDTQVNTATGTVMLRANFDNEDESLYPSQFVNIEMLLNTLKDTVTVPVSAVQRGAPGTYVYLVNENSTVSVHTIKLGPQDGDFYAVESGLSPGDTVVTDGADRLRDGVKVTLPDNTHVEGAGSAKGPGGRGQGGWKGAHGGDSGSADRPDRQHHHRPQQGAPQQQDGSQQPGAPQPQTQDSTQPQPGAPQPQATPPRQTQRGSAP